MYRLKEKGTVPAKDIFYRINILTLAGFVVMLTLTLKLTVKLVSS
jgi:hypothetical protein